MAKLSLRGASAAKGTARKSASTAGGSSKGGSKATAKFKKGGRGRPNGGVPYSGQHGGTGGSDTSFDFGGNEF